MSLGLVFDPLFKRHEPGFGHPERPARLDAVEAAVRDSGVESAVLRVTPSLVARELLECVHDPAYVARIEAHCREGRGYIDTPDSAINAASGEVAMLAAGAVVELAERIHAGDVRRGFAAVRPPGHHAERDQSMGFCLLANVALAAEAMRRRGHRVAILDWDVHHGNGTQHIFEADADVFFASLHGHPDHLYPGTGYADETGVGRGAGATLNVPMQPGAGDREYAAALTQQVLPAIERFEPTFLMISAGFDAHRDDPLGCIQLSDAAFDEMLGRARELADRVCGGRLLSVLEGGYNLDVLRRCVAAHLRGLSSG
jgi:acetoin utilization deacetylase AcuC-like enzyme